MDQNGLRRRRRSVEPDTSEGSGGISELDMFTKIADDCSETSATRGGFTICTGLVIIFMVVLEIIYYEEVHIRYEYDVDKRVDQSLKINFDITVAMPCKHVSFDAIDASNDHVDMSGNYKEIPVTYDLDKGNHQMWKMRAEYATYFKSTFHSMHEMMVKHRFASWDSSFGVEIDGQETSEETATGCRIKGIIEVPKTSGTLTLVAGKSVKVDMGAGHAHMTFVVPNMKVNFSHRINHLSFGDEAPGRLNPLDFTDNPAKSDLVYYQYRLQVAPYSVETRSLDLHDSFQFSSTENHREIDHSKGSHGRSGIEIQYEMFPISVLVRETSKSIIVLFVRLGAIVAGVFATAAMLENLTGAGCSAFCCYFGVSTRSSNEFLGTDLSQPSSPLTQSLASDSLSCSLHIPSSIQDKNLGASHPVLGLTSTPEENGKTLQLSFNAGDGRSRTEDKYFETVNLDS